MEKIGMQENEIKIGDIFFASLKGVRCWGIGHNEKNDCLVQSTINVSHCFEDILIAVRYIGKGVIEEMVTGEKMLIIGKDRDLCSNNYNFPDHRYADYKDRDWKPARYFDFELQYEVFNRHDHNGRKYSSYADDVKRISAEYPLTFDDNDYIYYIDDELKKLYLKHSDEERKHAIMKMKDNTRESIHEVNVKVDRERQKDVVLTSEMLDMAYLENQLYDFENKGRSK